MSPCVVHSPLAVVRASVRNGTGDGVTEVVMIALEPMWEMFPLLSMLATAMLVLDLHPASVKEQEYHGGSCVPRISAHLVLDRRITCVSLASLHW